MQNITRTLNKYYIAAYDLTDGDEGLSIEKKAETYVEATSMTRSEARALLAEETGAKLPKGLTIKWEVVGTTTYAMTIEEFINQATIISTTEGE